MSKLKITKIAVGSCLCIGVCLVALAYDWRNPPQDAPLDSELRMPHSVLSTLKISD